MCSSTRSAQLEGRKHNEIYTSVAADDTPRTISDYLTTSGEGGFSTNIIDHILLFLYTCGLLSGCSTSVFHIQRHSSGFPCHPPPP